VESYTNVIPTSILHYTGCSHVVLILIYFVLIPEVSTNLTSYIVIDYLNIFVLNSVNIVVQLPSFRLKKCKNSSSNHGLHAPGSSGSGMWVYGLDRVGSGEEVLAGTCEFGNEPSGSIKCGEFLYWLRIG